MSPIVTVLTPITLARNSGRRLKIISLDTSVRKLTNVRIQIFRGTRDALKETDRAVRSERFVTVDQME